MKTVDISIIVPMYNEHELIGVFFSAIKKVLSSVPQYTYEIICINDGSTDNTLNILKKYAKQDKKIKIISFSRNFHKEQAMFAGLKSCTGRVAIPIDADLQDPPEIILKFLARWEQGYQVVYGVRVDRDEDGIVKKFLASAFYKVFNLLSERPIPFNTGDFRLIDRKVINAIKLFQEKELFMKGVFNWVGFKSIGVNYARPKRAAGKSKWNCWKLWNFALDELTSFSTLPLRIWTYLGTFIFLISLFYGAYIFTRTLIYGIDVSGYASLLIFILFFGGLQLFILGVFGEYISRILIEVKNRPLYIIDKK